MLVEIVHLAGELSEPIAHVVGDIVDVEAAAVNESEHSGSAVLTAHDDISADPALRHVIIGVLSGIAVCLVYYIEMLSLGKAAELAAGLCLPAELCCYVERLSLVYRVGKRSGCHCETEYDR